MLAVVDYGMGNLRSVHKALEKLGYAAAVTSDPRTVERAQGIVLPGVGAFADAARRLRELGLDEVIRRAVAAGRPFLGICLGLQLLFEVSEENGPHQGLGIFPGRVRRLGPELKVPHMGWNQVERVRPSPLFSGVPDGVPFYFVHSYYADPADPELVLAATDYGRSFPCVVGRGVVFGVQFHPEKSSRWGLKLLSNFGEMVARCW
ncbi:MAG: imidazole glycerol phosphate synthase subunit HisH [Clostridia bacterium]|nr:imidazole glycerol phosphate synthase subunit HisH [Clostridia bacterium]MDH7573667.1 imidazole glycerol phosphate synthase subunit HisH [Clostridia bacterium]